MRFEPAPGLDAKVASMLVPTVTEIAVTVAAAARDAAPKDKQWVTKGDERVRDEHRDADGQTVPVNLRYALETPRSDLRYTSQSVQLGGYPRSTEFTPGLTVECRCESVPTGTSSIADAIAADAALVIGTRVTAQVRCEADLCVNAEHGNAVDSGARFMAAGLRAGARRLRTG
jgi:hypothetical protein